MATKKAKKVTEQKVVDFSNSMEKVKATTKTVNQEVMNTATEVLEDIRTNSARIRETASKRVKETMENATVENGITFVKKTAKNMNQYTLETADELVDEALKGSQKWQKVSAKAVKGGIELAEKNQEIVFDALEELKGQLVNSAKRFRGLFSKN